MSPREGSYYSGVVGASVERDFSISHQQGLGNIIRMAELIDKIGGEKNIEAYVAFHTKGLAVRTQDQKYYSLQDGHQMQDAELKLLRETYRTIAKTLQQHNEISKLKAVWQEALQPKNQSGVQSLSLNGRFPVEADGDLDLSRMGLQFNTIAKNGLTPQKASPGYPFEVDDTWCGWFFCGWPTFRSLESDTQVNVGGKYTSRNDVLKKVAGGVAQEASLYSLDPNAPDYRAADFLSKEIKPAPIGCGVASSLAMLDWWWRVKDINWYGMKASSNAKPLYNIDNVRSDNAGFTERVTKSRFGNQYDNNNQLFTPTTHPIMALGDGGTNQRPKYWQWTGGEYFVNGYVVTPRGVDNGFQGFLSEQKALGYGTQLNVYSSWRYVYGGLTVVGLWLDANSLADIVRKGVGQQNVPVIGLYHVSNPNYALGNFDYRNLLAPWHFSPVTSYWVQYVLGRANLSVSLMDSPGETTNLTDAWGFTSGVWSIW